MSEGENRSIVNRLRDVAAFFQKEHGRVDAAGCIANEAADTITSLTTQLEAERERATKAEAALREQAMEYLALDQQVTEALARAVKAEEERDRLREELRREKERSVGTWATQRENDQLTILYHEAKAALAAALKTGAPHD